MLLGEEKRLDNFSAGKTSHLQAKFVCRWLLRVCFEFDYQKQDKKQRVKDQEGQR